MLICINLVMVSSLLLVRFSTVSGPVQSSGIVQFIVPWIVVSLKIIFSDPVLNEEGGKKITHVERWFSVSASWALPSRHLGVLLTTFLESILAACAEILYRVHMLQLSNSACQKSLLNKSFQSR